MQAQSAQSQSEAEATDHQKQLDEGEHQREEEKHKAEMNQVKGQAAYNAVQHAKSTKDIVKSTGASKTVTVDGKKIKNPLNN